MTEQIVVEPDGGALAASVAGRMLREISAVQSVRRTPSIVLTGGSIADRVHREIAATTQRHQVDWSDVELWWGDERFVDRDDPDRNERQARLAFLDALGTDPERVHPIPAADDVADPDEAAELYAGTLRSHAGDGFAPRFDILMLGVGPDGHVASLFPGYQQLHETRHAAVGVLGAPKPPPDRITLTYAALGRARQVWFVVSGEEKAEAVGRAVAGDRVERTPAAGVRGTEETVWLLDGAAASGLPTR